MKIEIMEEEREFLERVCDRALNFSKMGVKAIVVENKDLNLKKLENLVEKFKK
jgi:hypothetical protein